MPPGDASAGRRFSLAARLALAYAAGALVLVLGSTAALYLALGAALEHELQVELRDEVDEIEAAVRAPDFERAIRDFASREDARVPPRLFVRVRAADGTAIAESPFLARELPAADALPVLAEGRGSETTESGIPLDVARHVVARGRERYLVELALDRREIEALLATWRGRAAWIVTAALAASAAGAYILARRGVRPIAQVTEAARRVSSQTLGAERLDVRGAPAEIAELAETFNAMLDRLDAAFRRLKDLGADLAHELRTPVQNVRGEAEVALLKDRSTADYRDVLGGVLEQCDRLSRVIDDILLIERTEGRPDSLQLSDVDLAKEIEELRAYFEASASGRGIAIEQTNGAPSTLPLRADRLKVRRALANLVDNAIKYTPDGGRVTLAARDLGRDGVEVVVEDTGIGIAKEDLARVFERFFRVEKSRTRSESGTAGGGTGLGLAIARTLVRAHGGDVRLESEPGRGTRAIVRLPRGAMG